MSFLKQTSRHWILIALLISFGAGVVFGQWYARERFHNHWGKGSMREIMLERFSKELHLTDDQKKQVAAIFEAQHPKMVALQNQMQPQFEAIRNSTQAEVQKILRPDQQKDFEAMNSKMEEHWKKRQKFFNT